MEYINLKAQYNFLKDDIDANIQKVLDSAQFIMGDMVKEFEQELAQYVGVEHAISCSDGTAALQLIYMAYGIGKGDAVFCPDMTFIASIEPAVMLGAAPVFCDIDAKTYNIDAESLEIQIKAVIHEGKLTPKAIVAVDFLGNPADFSKLRVLADRYGLLLIEDAAQGMSAGISGKRCGSFGDIAVTSFFPSKPLGCYGDGGAVFTNDAHIAEVIQSLRVHGKGEDKYHNIRIGMNSRLDNIQAGILLAKLKELPNEIEKRQKIAQLYNNLLCDSVIVPYTEENHISAYAQYVVCAEDAIAREQVRTALSAKQIPTILYYPTPMHMLPVFAETNQYGMQFPNAVSYSESSFGIPFSPYITQNEQKNVAKVIQSFYKAKR